MDLHPWATDKEQPHTLGAVIMSVWEIWGWNCVYNVHVHCIWISVKCTNCQKKKSNCPKISSKKGSSKFREQFCKCRQSNSESFGISHMHVFRKLWVRLAGLWPRSRLCDVTVTWPDLRLAFNCSHICASCSFEEGMPSLSLLRRCVREIAPEN